MSNFAYENDYLYCKKCKEQNIIHKVYILLNTKTAFEIEFGELKKPMVFEIKRDSPELYCECCKTREIITANDIDLQLH